MDFSKNEDRSAESPQQAPSANVGERSGAGRARKRTCECKGQLAIKFFGVGQTVGVTNRQNTVHIPKTERGPCARWNSPVDHTELLLVFLEELTRIPLLSSSAQAASHIRTRKRQSEDFVYITHTTTKQTENPPLAEHIPQFTSEASSLKHHKNNPSRSTKHPHEHLASGYQATSCACWWPKVLGRTVSITSLTALEVKCLSEYLALRQPEERESSSRNNGKACKSPNPWFAHG